MFRLKIKSVNYTAETTKFFKTLEEVAHEIARICNAKTLEEVLKKQKEFNFRFYIKYCKEF